MSGVGVDPNVLIEQAESEKSTLSEDAEVAYSWFDDRLGEMFPRNEAVGGVAELLDCDDRWAARVIADLVDDVVDPVQQIRSNGEKYVGIIDFETFPDAGAYGYEAYDDVDGRRKRMVCAKCVQESTTAAEVTYAEAGTGSIPDDAGYDRLLNRITSHYANNHEDAPDGIEIGASLVAGTTVNSNTAWHAGNDGQGSGLDADTLKDRDVGSELDDHEGESTGVHGVGDDEIESTSGAQAKVDDHATENVGVHGAGSSGLASSDDVEAQVGNHADETEGVHGAPANVALVHEGTPVENLTTELAEGQSLAIDSDGNIVSREADTDVHPVADEEERLALDEATQGDYAIQEDTDTTYILSGGDPSVDDNWSEIEFNRYTDGEAVEAVDAEVTESAASVSGLDTEVSGKADSADVSDIQASPDVDHDQTQGGTAGNPHADSAHVSDVSDIQASSDVDHDQTTNRTHDGDELSPATLEAEDSVTVGGPHDDYEVEFLGVFQSEADLPDGTNPALAYVVDENEFATRGV